MKQLKIIYHTQSGRNALLLEAFLAGTKKVQGICCSAIRAIDVESRHFKSADAIVLIGAEYFGAVPGQMLDMLNRLFYPLQNQVSGLPYFIVMSTGSGSLGAISQWDKLLSAMAMKSCGEPLVFYGDITIEQQQCALEWGEAIATGLVLGIY